MTPRTPLVPIRTPRPPPPLANVQDLFDLAHVRDHHLGQSVYPDLSLLFPIENRHLPLAPLWGQQVPQGLVIELEVRRPQDPFPRGLPFDDPKDLFHRERDHPGRLRRARHRVTLPAPRLTIGETEGIVTQHGRPDVRERRGQVSLGVGSGGREDLVKVPIASGAVCESERPGPGTPSVHQGGPGVGIRRAGDRSDPTSIIERWSVLFPDLARIDQRLGESRLA